MDLTRNQWIGIAVVVVVIIVIIVYFAFFRKDDFGARVMVWSADGKTPYGNQFGSKEAAMEACKKDSRCIAVGTNTVDTMPLNENNVPWKAKANVFNLYMKPGPGHREWQPPAPAPPVAPKSVVGSGPVVSKSVVGSGPVVSKSVVDSGPPGMPPGLVAPHPTFEQQQRVQRHEFNHHWHW